MLENGCSWFRQSRPLRRVQAFSVLVKQVIFYSVRLKQGDHKNNTKKRYTLGAYLNKIMSENK